MLCLYANVFLVIKRPVDRGVFVFVLAISSADDDNRKVHV